MTSTQEDTHRVEVEGIVRKVFKKATRKNALQIVTESTLRRTRWRQLTAMQAQELKT